MKYNHAYDICFSLESNHEFGEDVTPDMLRTALLNRIKDLDKANEWGEIHANSVPFDTYEIEEDETFLMTKLLTFTICTLDWRTK